MAITDRPAEAAMNVIGSVGVTPKSRIDSTAVSSVRWSLPFDDLPIRSIVPDADTTGAWRVEADGSVTPGRLFGSFGSGMTVDTCRSSYVLIACPVQVKLAIEEHVLGAQLIREDGFRIVPAFGRRAKSPAFQPVVMLLDRRLVSLEFQSTPILKRGVVRGIREGCRGDLILEKRDRGV